MSEPAGAPRRAFVAGATGLTGRFVVRHLRALGHDVVAHVRPDSARLSEWRASFSATGAIVDDSPWDANSIARSLAGHRPDLVFALLGTTQARMRAGRRAGDASNARGYAEVDVGMTQMLLTGARALCPRPRFVYLSSAGAGTRGKGAYLDARTEVEAMLRSTGVPYTIARPSFIVGDRDDARPLERLGVPAAGAALGLLRLVGAGRVADRYAAITGDALAAALVRLALDPAWQDRIAEREDLVSS